MAAQNKRSQDELFAFLSLLSNDQQLKLKYFSLESRQVRKEFIISLGFDPDLIRDSLSEIPIQVGTKTTNLLDFLISKGVDEVTPLPVGIVLSALRSAGSDASFASIEESFTDFQSKLGSSAGGSAPQPRSIESIDPRDADRLVERDVVDTSRDQGLADFKDSSPSRELSRDSGDEFSASSRSKDDIFSSPGKFSSQASETKSPDNAYSLSRFDQHNDQLKSFSSQRSDLISSLMNRPSSDTVRRDEPNDNREERNVDRSISDTQRTSEQRQISEQLINKASEQNPVIGIPARDLRGLASDLRSASNDASRDTPDSRETAGEIRESNAEASKELTEDKKEVDKLDKSLANLKEEDPQLYKKYQDAMDTADADKFMSSLASDLGDAKISPQETIELLHAFMSDTLTRLRSDPTIPQDLLDRFVDSNIKSLDEKESDLAALTEAAAKNDSSSDSNDSSSDRSDSNKSDSNQGSGGSDYVSVWLGPTLKVVDFLIRTAFRVGVGWTAKAEWQQALKDAYEKGKSGETDPDDPQTTNS